MLPVVRGYATILVLNHLSFSMVRPQQPPWWMTMLFMIMAGNAVLSGVVVFYGFQSDIFPAAMDEPFRVTRALRQVRYATPPSPAYVEEWMTFSYVETVFHLPSHYIANHLKLSDPKYPRLTIRAYASRHQLSTDLLLMEVRELLGNFPSSTTPSPSSTYDRHS